MGSVRFSIFQSLKFILIFDYSFTPILEPIEPICPKCWKCPKWGKKTLIFFIHLKWFCRGYITQFGWSLDTILRPFLDGIFWAIARKYCSTGFRLPLRDNLSWKLIFRGVNFVIWPQFEEPKNPGFNTTLAAPHLEVSGYCRTSNQDYEWKSKSNHYSDTYV